MTSSTPKASLAAVFLVGAIVSPQNVALVAIAALALAVIWWDALASPFRAVMAVFFSLQWLQASMAIWIAAAAGLDLFRPGVFPVCQGCGQLPIAPTTPWAISLSLVCLASVAVGARVLQPRAGLSGLEDSLRELSPTRLLACYLVLFVVSRATGPFVAGGLAQPLIALANMRYFFVALLILVYVTSGRGRAVVAAVYLIEIAQGLIGFFSGFKTVFYLGIAVLLTLLMVHGRRVRPVILTSVVCVVCLGVFWTMIKPTYRAMLNEGTQQQVVTLGVGDSFKALGEASASTKEAGIGGGLADMALRISYTELLGTVMSYVPAAREHTAGALWVEAIAFVLQPRLLFPNKPALPSDSERTMLYTGQTFASDSSGTSISIGYVAESYVDFGAAGAVVVCFLIGAFYGACGRALSRASRGDSAAFIACTAAAFGMVQQFEISNMKLLPGFIWSFVVGWVFLSKAWPILRTFSSVESVARSVRNPLPEGDVRTRRPARWAS